MTRIVFQSGELTAMMKNAMEILAGNSYKNWSADVIPDRGKVGLLESLYNIRLSFNLY